MFSPTRFDTAPNSAPSPDRMPANAERSSCEFHLAGIPDRRISPMLFAYPQSLPLPQRLPRLRVKEVQSLPIEHELHFTPRHR